MKLLNAAVSMEVGGGRSLTSIRDERRPLIGFSDDSGSSFRQNGIGRAIKRQMTCGLLAIATLVLMTAAAFGQQPEKQQKLDGDEDGHRGIENLAAIVAEQTRLIEALRRQMDEQHKRFDEQARTLELLKQQLSEMRQHVSHAQRTSPDQVQMATTLSNDTQLDDGQAPPSSAQPRLSEPQTGRASNGVNGTGVGLVQWINGRPIIRSSDGHFEMNFSSYSQLDYRGYQSGANAPANSFVLRRARLSIGGKMYDHFEYKLQGDFADTNGTVLRDAWINLKYRPSLQLRFGQFKEPFSQEELRGDENQDFVERSMVNALSPSRSPGMQMWGEMLNGRLEYQTGLFNGKGLLMNNTSSTPEAVVRLRLSPWNQSSDERIKQLSLGGAWAVGRQRGGMSFNGRTESRSAEFFMAEPVNGAITRANAELTYVFKSFALRAEYDQAHQERIGLGPRKSNLPGVIGKGYTAQATYLLTDEAKPDDGAVEPKSRILPGEGQKAGAGAWELKFRYSNLQLANGFVGNRAETFTTGVNWYLNRYFKYVVDLNFERFKNPNLTPNPGDQNFFTVLTRLQIQF
jgi:phosphate-selective porin OprO/OprP